MSDFALTLLLGWFRATRIRVPGCRSEPDRGERRTVPVPAIAGSSAAESAATVSAMAVRTGRDCLRGSRTTAMTS